jgi:hypothetical protein
MNRLSVLWVMQLMKMLIELLSLVDQVSQRSEQQLPDVLHLEVAIGLLLCLLDILF